MKIKNLEAYEVLDSRGNPTVKVKIKLNDGTEESATIPSGASTGTKEALELRDNDQERFHGKGVLKACKNVNEKIFPILKNKDPSEQEKIDQIMLDLDGTENKSQLGANAILAVSLAVAKASARSQKKHLWQYLGEKYDFPRANGSNFPSLMMNVINGGAHADSGIDIQEYMFVIGGFPKLFDRVRTGSELYHELREYLHENNYRVAVGDEGGFAPQLSSNEEPFQIMTKVLDRHSAPKYSKISLGIDAAASEFFQDGKYTLKLDVKSYDNHQMRDEYEKWMKKYDLSLIEDPFSENDWKAWTQFTKNNSEKATIIGDDLLVTQEKFVQKAIDEKACNAVLIKVNQVGSLSETIKTIKLAQDNNLKIAVSHRSGETVEDFIADLAIASGAEYVKFGSPARSDRAIKYNRLIEIEREINSLS